MPYTQRVLLGFAAGAMLLGIPWPGGPTLPLGLALAGAAGLAPIVLLRCLGRLSGSLAPVFWGALLGLCWSGLTHHMALEARVVGDGSTGARPLTLRVTSVSDLSQPATQPATACFTARVVEAPGSESGLAGATLRLSWHAAPALQRGELWRVQAVAKAPWSYANPGGFDYERWLLGKRIHGTGWVRDGERLSGPVPGWLDRLRDRVADRVEQVDLRWRGVVLALLLGRAAGIPETTWEILRLTGTVHLMVISGLHVSLAAALGFAMGGAMCRLCPLLPLWLDARRAGCALGGLVAVTYVALAGAGLAAVRALIMSMAVLTLLAGGSRGRPAALLLLALALLLALEPLAVHQQGFWLSFGAVAILMLAVGPVAGEAGALRAAVRAQLALSVGMLPGLALVTASVPWTGPAANALAVPLMSIVVIPMVLAAGVLSLLWPAAADLLLTGADALLSLQFRWLEWLARAPVPLAPSATLGLVLAQSAAVCWLLGAPRGHWPLLLLCLAAPLAPRSTTLAHGEFRVTALDVGQGTSVLVETRRHRLLYDAGPAFPGGFDAGRAVVVPSLAAVGSRRLDVLVLSHDDVDHVGGADAVRAALAPRRTLLGMGGNGAGADLCHGRSWRWDAVEFRFLDVAGEAAADNDRSCILLVRAGDQRMLLAGDIGAGVESRVLRRLVGEAPVALMFAPHHGSISSSSPALVRIARPALVFVSAGRGNRFGHPHPGVVARYRRVGARLHQTGLEGALIWRSSEPARVTRWRAERSAYWRAGSGGV